MVSSVVLPTLLGVADMAAVTAALGTVGAAAAAFAVNFAVSMIVTRVLVKANKARKTAELVSKCRLQM